MMKNDSSYFALSELKRRLHGYRPEPFGLPENYPRAAVLVPITRGEAPELVLTLRSKTLPTHAGEVAFPGGRWEKTDSSLVQTALREAYEEVALPASQVEVIGHLSPLLSLHRLRVTPYIGLVPEDFRYRVDGAETEAVFSVPLSFFCKHPDRVTQRPGHHGEMWFIPYYYYHGFKIWGLTAIMIVELVNLWFDAGISLFEPPADGQITRP